MAKPGGFDLLMDTASRILRMRSESLLYVQRVESPIEALLIQAVDLRFLLNAPEFDQLEMVSDEDERWHLADLSGGPLVICRTQADISAGSRGEEEKWRSDFVFHCCGVSWSPTGYSVRWHRLIVECDGHDFHERTKEQAARDRARDRAATLSGYDIMRFTGSQIWGDPWGCAGEVVAWANKGLA